MYIAHINYTNLPTIEAYFNIMFKNVEQTTYEKYYSLLKK
jgi:hypothetical protein